MIATRRALSSGGGAVVLAPERATGHPAGSGLFPAPCEQVTELSGVATGDAFRRRGVAAAVSSLLVQLAADRRVELLWLNPEHEQAERIYARVGFSRLGATTLHLSRRALTGSEPDKLTG